MTNAERKEKLEFLVKAKDPYIATRRQGYYCYFWFDSTKDKVVDVRFKEDGQCTTFWEYHEEDKLKLVDAELLKLCQEAEAKQ